MNPRKSSRGTVFKINICLLGAFSYAVGAWLIWPDSIKWWGFGLVSIAFAIAAPKMLFKAIRMMFKLYERDKEFAEFEEANRAAEPSELASVDDLKKAGMIE